MGRRGGPIISSPCLQSLRQSPSLPVWFGCAQGLAFGVKFGGPSIHGWRLQSPPRIPQIYCWYSRRIWQLSEQTDSTVPQISCRGICKNCWTTNLRTQGYADSSGGYALYPTQEFIGAPSSLSRWWRIIFISRLVLSTNQSIGSFQRTAKDLFRYDSAK